MNNLGNPSSKDCEGYARDCMRLAGETKDNATREQLIQMARQWMGVAMDEEDKERDIVPKPR
jgi:hypothetical protein